MRKSLKERLQELASTGVAIAIPKTPNAGKPSQPNASIGLSKLLIKKLAMRTLRNDFVSPTAFSIALNIKVIVMKIAPQKMVTR